LPIRPFLQYLPCQLVTIVSGFTVLVGGTVLRTYAIALETIHLQLEDESSWSNAAGRSASADGVKLREGQSLTSV
jgi:hypothetical protein